MKSQFHLIVLGTLLLAGCSATARFYPVAGPLSAQTPPPVLVGKFTGAFYSGNLLVKLQDGEICKGRWVTVPRAQSSTTTPAAKVPPTGEMAPVWDTIYGTGFYVSRVLGARLYGKAVLTGEKGTILNVEIYKPEGNQEAVGAAAIKGVAKDNKENIYKVAF